MERKQQEVVTFKVDESVLELMRGIRNRSEFIRTALLAALDNLCPLCKGTGILTPHRKGHWEKLASTHTMRQCGDCQEDLTIVCEKRA